MVYLLHGGKRYDEHLHPYYKRTDNLTVFQYPHNVEQLRIILINSYQRI